MIIIMAKEALLKEEIKNVSYIQFFKFINFGMGKYKWLFVACIIFSFLQETLYFYQRFYFFTILDKIIDAKNSFKIRLPVSNQDFFVNFKNDIILLTILIGLFLLCVWILDQIRFKLRVLTSLYLTKKALNKLISFNINWHRQKHTAESLQKINTGITSYLTTLDIIGYNIVGTLSGIIVNLIYFASLGYWYLIILLSYGILISLNRFYFQKLINQLQLEKEKTLEQNSKEKSELVNNISTIKNYNVTANFMDRISVKLDENLDASEKLQKVQQLRYFIGLVLFWIGNVSIYLLLYVDFINSNINFATIGLAFANSGLLFRSLGSLSMIYKNFEEYKVKASRLIPLFEEEPKYNFGDEQLDKKWKTLGLNNLVFNYDNSDKKALNSINLEIKKGEKIGFVGKSGSGKSTLAKIIAGDYTINSGHVNIGEQNFYSIKEDQINDNITLIPQEAEIFDLSIRDNITLLKSYTDNQIKQVLEDSQLLEVIKELPNGLDTILGEKGYKLSGGQKQRIGIARGLIRKSEIYIFDESTSALDSKTEYLIQNALEKRLEGKTIILVAHRLSTLKNTDRIVSFKNGSIIEIGTFEKLSYDKNSYFGKMWAMQLVKSKA
jgi:ABC-type multidrug transport system fused ATPase/permease subunit